MKNIIFFFFLLFIIKVSGDGENITPPNIYFLNKFPSQTYTLETFIGTPQQIFSLQFSMFSKLTVLQCNKSENSIVFQRKSNIYFPYNSNSSILLSNISLNNNSFEQYLDVINFDVQNSMNTSNNITVSCINNDKNRSIGLNSPIFYSEHYPFVFICLYKNGGFIKTTNQFIKDATLDASFINYANINIANDDNLTEKKFLIKNFGVKMLDIISLSNSETFFSISINEKYSYNLFTSHLYWKINEFLRNKYFNNFDEYLNDENCFKINNFQIIKQKLPILVFLLNATNYFLEFSPIDYLLTYDDQDVYCFNFKENTFDDQNFISINLFQNKLIQLDFPHNSMKIIEFDCENNDLQQLFNPNFNVYHSESNQILINLLISLVCLLVFIGGSYSFVKIREYILKQRNNKKEKVIKLANSLTVKEKKKKNKSIELDDLKIEIIEKGKKNKEINKTKDKKNKYSYFEEIKEVNENSKDFEEIKEDNKIENKNEFLIIKDLEVIDKNKIKDKFLKKNKKPEIIKKKIKNSKKKYFISYSFLKNVVNESQFHEKLLFHMKIKINLKLFV